MFYYFQGSVDNCSTFIKEDPFLNFECCTQNGCNWSLESALQNLNYTQIQSLNSSNCPITIEEIVWMAIAIVLACVVIFGFVTVWISAIFFYFKPEANSRRVSNYNFEGSIATFWQLEFLFLLWSISDRFLDHFSDFLALNKLNRNSLIWIRLTLTLLGVVYNADPANISRFIC